MTNTPAPKAVEALPELPNEVVFIDYTNHRGERAVRKIRPLSINFTSTQYHPGFQWILHAVDVTKSERRHFAMKDIHGWGVTALAARSPQQEPKA